MLNTRIAIGRVKINEASTILADLYFQTKIIDAKNIIINQFSHIRIAGVVAS